jgi:ABC-2 type transport system ATP-binding protein
MSATQLGCPPPPTASIRDAVRVYGARTAVDGVTVEVHSGEITMLVGPNGCGKTTTMEMLVGLRRFTSGEAAVCGIPVRPGGGHRRYVGVQLQHSGLPSRIRVHEVLAAAGSLHAEPADARGLADTLGLAGHWNVSVDKLSGGLRRRLDIAAACMGRPPLLVLDEPTSGIDAEGRAEVWKFLRDRARAGTAVLASTHDLAEAEAFADRLLVMDSGRIRLSGAPDEVIASVGGQWRMRITDLSPRGRSVVAASGLTSCTAGAITIVVGSKEDVDALHARLQAQLLEHGEQAPEVLTGRIRLEDVFLLTAQRKVPSP